jgi:hypothetical protein
MEGVSGIRKESVMAINIIFFTVGPSAYLKGSIEGP